MFKGEAFIYEWFGILLFLLVMQWNTARRVPTVVIVKLPIGIEKRASNLHCMPKPKVLIELVAIA